MGHATMTQWGRRKSKTKKRWRQNAWITIFSEGWLQEVEGKVPPLPNIDDRHSNAYKLDLLIRVDKVRQLKGHRNIDTFSSGRDVSSPNFSCIP
jgi:hypothetical protein